MFSQYCGVCVGSNVKDDVMLQCIILLGTVCHDDACAKQLAEAGIIHILIDLLNGQ